MLKTTFFECCFVCKKKRICLFFQSLEKFCFFWQNKKTFFYRSLFPFFLFTQHLLGFVYQLFETIWNQCQIILLKEMKNLPIFQMNMRMELLTLVLFFFIKSACFFLFRELSGKKLHAAPHGRFFFCCDFEQNFVSTLFTMNIFVLRVCTTSFFSSLVST